MRCIIKNWSVLWNNCSAIYLQGKVTIQVHTVLLSETAPSASKLGMMAHHWELECRLKRLDWCFQSRGHSGDTDSPFAHLIFLYKTCNNKSSHTEEGNFCAPSVCRFWSTSGHDLSIFMGHFCVQQRSQTEQFLSLNPSLRSVSEASGTNSSILRQGKG